MLLHAKAEPWCGQQILKLTRPCQGGSMSMLLQSSSTSRSAMLPMLGFVSAACCDGCFGPRSCSTYCSAGLFSPTQPSLGCWHPLSRHACSGSCREGRGTRCAGAPPGDQETSSTSRSPTLSINSSSRTSGQRETESTIASFLPPSKTSADLGSRSQCSHANIRQDAYRRALLTIEQAQAHPRLSPCPQTPCRQDHHPRSGKQ